MDNKETRQEKLALHQSAEKLLVDTVLQNRGRNNLDKSLYNMQKMTESIDEQIADKRDLLTQLKENREMSKVNLDQQSILISIRKAQENLNKELHSQRVERIRTIDIDREDFNSVSYNQSFAIQENIDLEHPFLDLYSKNEQMIMTKEMIKTFDLLELDGADYGFAACAALIAGIVDVTLVGTISNKNKRGFLQKNVDQTYKETITKYGYNKKLNELKSHKEAATTQLGKESVQKKIDELTKSNKDDRFKKAVKHLENKHKVSYDTVRHSAVKGMEINNHHNVSLSHDFSPLGLIFGILDQLTGKASFISPETGDIIRVATENKNNVLDGNIIQQIIEATSNWFGHCISDISGSSTSTVRGTGLPAPFWNYLQKLNVGDIYVNKNNDSMTIGQLSDWMFKNGYDHRAFTTELIPVLIFETLIRIYWFYKQKFYYGKSIKQSLPIANSRELNRLLLIGASTFSTIDVTHATLNSISKGGVNPIGIGTFMMTVNKPGLIDLGFRSYQNVRFEIKHRKVVEDVFEKDLLVEYQRVMNSEALFE